MALLGVGVMAGPAWSQPRSVKRSPAVRVAARRPLAASSKRAATAPDGGYRAKSGKLDLFLPEDFKVEDGKYDLVLHFHGLARAQESNVTAAKLNAAVVSMNLGAVADKYGIAFRAPGSFDALVRRAHQMVLASGRAKGAKVGRIALSAWSAGFASVSAILKQEGAHDRVDAVFLADGLHASYSDPKKHTVNEHGLVKFARLSEEAAHGDKLFVITHSSIQTPGYANVTESVGVVLRLASLDKESPPPSAPRNMQPLYQINRGDLHITGFEGRGVSDHIDHIWAMGETMFPLLAARWSRTSG